MKTVFVDVDTQIDFLYPAGALYVPGAEALLPVLARLNQYAAAHGMPVLSTLDAHTENDPEFADWPPHCVAGTAGQRKPAQTLVPGQIFVEKQSLDCFTSPDLPGILERLAAERYVVYGVAGGVLTTADVICVKATPTATAGGHISAETSWPEGSFTRTWIRETRVETPCVPST